jgi:hypothetical protein
VQTYIAADQIIIGDSVGSDDLNGSDTGGDDSELQINLIFPIVAATTTDRVRSKNPTTGSLPPQGPYGKKQTRMNVALLFVVGCVVLLTTTSRVQRVVSQTHITKRKENMKDDLKKRILESSQYLSPPFDVLLSDYSSPLFKKVMKNWNETMEIVHSKADVFSARILQAVGTKEQVLAHAIIEWINVRESNNASIHEIQGSVSNGLLFQIDQQEPSVYALHINENWGYFSTAFSYPDARTVGWAVVERDPRWKDFVTSDNSSIAAIFSVQHHNFSDPALDNKVLSIPIGGTSLEDIWEKLASRSPDLLRDNDYDITLASPQQFRVRIFCYFINSKNFPRPERELGKFDNYSAYIERLATTRYVWTPGGMGIDCHRNWDVLTAGAIPIMERGFGLDRTYAYLPVFWIDTYYNLTATKLMDAYPLFVALRDEFDFSRLGKEYWKRLMLNVASEKSDNLLRNHHPFPKQRVIWPLPPPNVTVENFGAGFEEPDGVFAYCNSTLVDPK